MIKKTVDVTDYKWAHPDFAENPYHTMPNMDIFYRKLMTLDKEEQEEFQEKYFGAASLKALDEGGDERWKAWRAEGDFYTVYTEHGCPEEPEAPARRLIIRVPKDVKPDEKLPTVMAFPGSGLCLSGTAEGALMGMGAMFYTYKVHCVVVAVTYRLAPLHVCPAAINDCHAAYMYTIEHADEYHIDTDRIVFYGNSSGGHMSLSLPFRLKRYHYHGAPMPRGIIVSAPVMDDVAATESSRFTFRDEEGSALDWDSGMNRVGMTLWLGDSFGDPNLAPEYVPNRVQYEDLEMYPPVWFAGINEFEPSRDSAYRFAQLLHKRHIFCSFHEWGGTTHMSSSAEGTPCSDMLQNVICFSIEDAMRNDLRRQWLFAKGEN